MTVRAIAAFARQAAILGVIAACVHAQEEQQTAGQLFRAGLKEYETGDLAKAADLFDDACRADAGDWRGQFYRGLTLARLAQLEREPARRNSLFQQAFTAVDRLTKATGSHFNDPLVLFLEGYVATTAGQYGRGYDRLSEAVRVPRLGWKPYTRLKLRSHVEETLGIAAMRLGHKTLLAGDFELAQRYLNDADRYLSNDHKNRNTLEQNLAVVDEGLSQFESAERHLRNCAKLMPKRRDEFLGVSATMWLGQQKFDRAKKILSEIPVNSRDPDVVRARAALMRELGLKEGDGPQMDAAIAFYRETLESYPKGRAHRLVVDWCKLVDEKIAPGTEAENTELLKESLGYLRVEVKLRPECPIWYWFLHKFEFMLGNVDEAARLKLLHERKKLEWAKADKFDQHGRPRCGS
ncbi:MAG: hypothetical protein V3T86_02830 [Planctomycetota bacterium]